MTRRLLTATVVAAAIGAGLPNLQPVVAGAGKPPANISVKVTFRNATAPADRVLSVGSPTYANGETGVQAWINSSTGGLVLNTCITLRGGKSCSSQGRYHDFDYGDPANLLLPLPFSTPTIAAAVFEVAPFEADGVTILPRGLLDVMHTPGETRLGRMKVNFPVDGSGYTLRFTPNMYSTSSYLLVTYLGGTTSCTAANPADCANWSVETVNGSFTPYPDSSCCWTTSLDDIAELVTMNNSADYGQFHMPFKFTVSVLPH
jgi:hypothetical protein